METSQDLNQKLDDFFRDCQKQAYSIAYLSVNNKADSLDVVQNTMIAFIKYYKNKPDDQWKPLFYRVLQNKINDHFRGKKSWFQLFSQPSEHEEDAVSPLQGEDHETPTDSYRSGEIIDQVSEAISHLPERQKQVVVYRLWQGFSVKETAKIMKVSQGSIKTHLSRALSQLKGQLGDLYNG